MRVRSRPLGRSYAIHYYRSYAIHVSAISRRHGLSQGWQGIVFVFDPKKSSRELKRVDTGHVVFLESTEEARELALALCKKWIDEVQNVRALIQQEGDE